MKSKTLRGIATVLCLVLAACGGGGGGGGGPTAPTPPPQPTTGLFFNAAGAPGSATVHLDASSVTSFGSNFVLRVVANDVSDLYGVSFDLRYPDNRLNFLPAQTAEGSFLSSGGFETTMEVLRSGNGNLIVGISRLGEVEGASGSGTLLTLEFSIEDGAGSGPLNFRDNDALDSAGAFLDATAWLGGSIDVRR